MAKEVKRLTEKEIKEGEEILALVETLDTEAKMQAKIYLSALSDRCNYVAPRN